LLVIVVQGRSLQIALYPPCEPSERKAQKIREDARIKNDWRTLPCREEASTRM
jgi:hypothetical protein